MQFYTKGKYYLMYIKDLDGYPTNWDGDAAFIANAIKTNKKFFVVTSQVDKVKQFIEKKYDGANAIQFLSCDATVMKTVARVNPTLYLMDGPVVEKKWSWTEFKKAMMNDER